jgi:thymidylate synthase ThyX
MLTEISAQVIEDSISELGIRLTTLQLRFPRFILAELNTHRQISKNARSTRAVPTLKLIDEVRTKPFIPVKWLKNKPGMQATEPMSPEDAVKAEALWRQAAASAADYAEALFATGLHKQWAGRVLEPFMYVDSLVSSTHWANFEALRDHPDAQPEIEVLAKAIIAARAASKPTPLKQGQWHLPYCTFEEKFTVSQTGDYRDALKLSTARCARVSYAPFDGNASPEKEIERYFNLVGSTPIHASPTEHQATPDIMVVKAGNPHFGRKDWEFPEKHGNFFGWKQHRKFIDNNYIPDSWENISL